MKRMLIAGIGNIFHGDDAFGVEVVWRLKQRTWLEDVDVVDFGIRAYDLAYALIEDYKVIVLIDAVPMHKSPGTVCLIEPDLDALDQLGCYAVDPHLMNPTSVLRLAQSLGSIDARLFLIGCEPSVLRSEDGDLGLSKPVQAAVPRAITLCQSLVKLMKLKRKKEAGLVPA